MPIATDKPNSINELEEEVQRLKDVLEEKQASLEEAKETLEAIRSGAVDGIIRNTAKGDEVFILRGSEEPYRDLVEQMNEGAILLSESGLILYCNTGFAQIVHAPIDKIIGSNVKDWVPSQYSEPLNNAIIEGKSSTKSVIEIGYRNNKKQIIPTQTSVNRISFESINAIALIITDLSKHMEKEVKAYTISLEKQIIKRKKAEENLGYSNQRLEIISEIANILLSSTEPERVIQLICEKVMFFLDCQVFFNFIVDEGKNSLHLNAYTGVQPEKVKKVECLKFGEAVCGCSAQRGQQIVCENILESQDSISEFVRSLGVNAYASTPVFLEEAVVGTISFGSENKSAFSVYELSLMRIVAAQVGIAFKRKKIEESLKEAQNKLQSYAVNLEELVASRTKQLHESEHFAAIGQVAGMVGHDIRNPLQAITNELFMAKELMINSPKIIDTQEAMNSLEFIQEQVDYINKIVADLQDFARPLKPNFSQVNLHQFIASALKGIIIPDCIELVFEYEEDSQCLKLDPTFMTRILNNLVNNAVQAMPEGGKLTIKAYKENTTNVIIIEDTGIGIPDEFKQKIFTPMFTTKAKGQGFGLAVVKRLIEAQGGSITYESEVGKGTRFILQLSDLSSPNTILNKDLITNIILRKNTPP